MTAAAQAAPAFTLPEIGQPFGGGFFSGITRDPDTGKRRMHFGFPPFPPDRKNF